MDCSYIHKNLIAYRENNLPPGISKEFESHLSECQSCRTLFSGWENIERAIESARAAEPGPFVATRILQHIESSLEKKTGKGKLIFRPVLVTMAVIGAIALGVTIGKSGFERITASSGNKSQIETLKSDLYIRDFIEEDNTLLINE